MLRVSDVAVRDGRPDVPRTPYAGPVRSHAAGTARRFSGLPHERTRRHTGSAVASA